MSHTQTVVGTVSLMGKKGGPFSKPLKSLLCELSRTDCPKCVILHVRSTKTTKDQRGSLSVAIKRV